MRKLTLAALLSIFLCVQTAYAAATVFRAVPLDAAKETASKEGKLLLIDFTAAWCGPCHRMDAETWGNPVVQKWVNENAIAIQLDVDKDTKEAASFKIIAMPSVVVYEPKDMAKEFDRHVGYLNSADFLEWMTGVKRGETALDSLRHSVEKVIGKGGEEEVLARRKFAIALMDKDSYPEAVDHYLWLWQHMPNEVPTASGERIAAMGGDIFRLITKYPPARPKFEELRDKAEKDHKMLDYVVLNEVLSEQKRTLAWFDKIKQDPKSAADLQDVEVILERILVTNNRWSDLRFIFPDPMLELKERAQVSDMVKEEFAKRGMKSPYDPFIKDAAIIYVSLLASHKDAEARKLAAEALKLRNTEALKKQFVITALSAKQPRKDQRKWVLEDKQLLSKLDAALAPAKKKK